MSQKVLIVQRVITSYRFELLQELAPYVNVLGFVTSQGDDNGTLKKYKPKKIKYDNIKIYPLDAIKLNYKGDSRGTSLFFYPSVLKLINTYDVIILEGTTNIINNLLIIPYAKILNKKIIWWDAGYSLEHRTFKRKVIDFTVRQLVRFTNVQFAYSTKAKLYMEKYMGARNCHLLLNTINTEYFESIQEEIQENIKKYNFNENNIKFLYVGAIEERKKIKELIDIVNEMNQSKQVYSLTIIGGGNYLTFLKEYVKDNKINNITFTGAIYDKEKLKKYYFDSDLFILPGDGGLGILQSLFYGLPVVCFTADGTEEDYMNKKYILKELQEIKDIYFKILRNKFDYSEFYKKVNSLNYVQNFAKLVND